MSSQPVTVEVAVEAINRVLGDRRGDGRVEADARLEEIGLDSLDMAELFIALEEDAGCQLDPTSAGALERVADLSNLRPL